MTRLLEIDQELVEAVTRGSGAPTAEMAVENVLRRHLLFQRQEAIRELRGGVGFWPDYDHKKMRESRTSDES